MNEQQQPTIEQLLNESIINIQELSIDYDNTIHAYCPKLQKISQWAGVCLRCFKFHPDMIKFIILEDVITAIQDSEKYMMIDIVNFSKVLNTKFSSELNIIQKESEDKAQISLEEIEKKIKYIREQKDTIIQQQINEDSFAEFCSANELSNTTDYKYIMVLCNQKEFYWNGYCPKCRENKKHFIYVKKKPSGAYLLSYFSPYYSKIETIDTCDYRLINVCQFQLKIEKYLEEQVYEKFMKRQQHIIEEQFNLLKSVNETFEKNEKSILELQLRSEQFQLLKNNQNNIEKLEKENKDLKYVIQKFEESQFYDIQIHCANLYDLQNEGGWKVIENEFYQQQKDQKCLVVSFYGLYNKGKSFLVSQLSKKKIPLGYSTQTGGLSALYPREMCKENSIIFLDTEGLEKPIDHYKEDAVYEEYKKQYEGNDDSLYTKIYEEKFMDRLVTVNLVQQFLLNQSNFIIIVVEMLTKDEQRLIQKIRKNYENSEIVIVHNFNKFDQLSQVQKYIEIDILNSFQDIEKQFRNLDKISSGKGNIQESEDVNIKQDEGVNIKQDEGQNIKQDEGGNTEKCGNIYIQKKYNQKGEQLKPIVHLIMAKDKSEAGNKYNPFCLHYLQNKIVSETKFEKFDIVQSLKAEIEKEIHNIFNFKSEQLDTKDIFHYDEKKKAIKTTIKFNQFKYISFNILGDMYLQDQADTDTPKYFYEVTNEQLILNVELFGKFEPQNNDKEEKLKNLICSCDKSGCSLLQWHGFINNEQVIKIRAQYLGPISSNLQKPNQIDARFGRFQLTVPISPDICVLKLSSRPIFSYQLGLARFEYSIQNKSKAQK